MIAGKNPCGQIQHVQNWDLVELGICDGRNMYPENNVWGGGGLWNKIFSHWIPVLVSIDACRLCSSERVPCYTSCTVYLGQYVSIIGI